MKVLKELISFINRYKIRSIEVLDAETPKKDTLLWKLYTYLEANKDTTDSKALEHLYGSGGDANYKRLKSRLKKRLLNNIFFIDVNQVGYSSLQRAYYSSWKDFAAAKILLGRLARNSSTVLLKKVLKNAIKYEFTELAMQASRELKKYYGSVLRDLKKFEHYQYIHNKYKEQYNTEIEVEDLYMSLLAKEGGVKYTEEIRQELYAEASKSYAKIKPQIDKNCSSKIYFLCYLIELFICFSINDYKKIVIICEEAIRFFEQKGKILLAGERQALFHRLLVALIQLKDYKKGRIVAEQVSSIAQESNWVLSQRLYWLLCAHAKEYTQAYSILMAVRQDRRYKQLPKQKFEVWKLYEAYTSYLIAIGQIPAEKVKVKFRLGKFLNEMPSFSKDKRGRNIPVLVIQILFWIHRKDHDKVIDRTDALKRYLSRHIKETENFRSNAFIKMLLQVPLGGFRKGTVGRLAEKYKKKLYSKPINEASQAFEIEMLPYEDLWEFVIESL